MEHLALLVERAADRAPITDIRAAGTEVLRRRALRAPDDRRHGRNLPASASSSGIAPAGFLPASASAGGGRPENESALPPGGYAPGDSMGESSQLRVGVVGAGFLAETRARCWRQVPSAEIAGVVARRRERAEDYAGRFDVPVVFRDLDAMLESPDIDVVDLCVPNSLHREMTEAAAGAGKHVICTKPLTAYTGQDLPESASDDEIAARDRSEMLRVVEADARAMVQAAKQARVQLLYGENWIHAPAFRRARALLERADGVLLEMRGGECHSGSHSPYSRVWRHTGGGALIRLAAHPVGAMLHLKRLEGLRRRGEPVRPAWVSADTADLSAVAGVSERELRIAGGWGEVENWGCATIGFDDGSRAVAWGGDHVLGGMESALDLFASNCRLRLDLSPNDMLRAYAPDGGVFGDSYIMEKIDSGAGWTTPMPDEDWTSGQLGMCQAFAGALLDGERAESDGELGLEVVRVLYAGYVAAVEGKKVALTPASSEPGSQAATKASDATQGGPEVGLDLPAPL